MAGDNHQSDRPHNSNRQFHQSGHQDHAAANHPEDTSHLVMSEIQVERPRDTKESQLDKDEPRAANQEVSGQVAMLAAVEEDAGSCEKYEGGSAEVGDPARKENTGGWTASWNAGINPYVVDRHQDHDCAANEIDGRDSRWRVDS